MPLILEEEIDLLGKAGEWAVWRRKGMRLKEPKLDQVAVKNYLKSTRRSETVTNEFEIMKELQEANSQSVNLVNVLTNIVNYIFASCARASCKKSYSIVLWIKRSTRAAKQRRR